MALVIEIRENNIQFIQAKKRSDGRIKVGNKFSVDFQLNEELDKNIGFNSEVKNLMKAMKMKECGAHIVLNNRISFSKELSLPHIPNIKKMSMLVRNELISSLNLTQDFVVDYYTVAEYDKENVKYERVMAVAVREKSIREIESWMKKIGLKIHSFQSGPSAMLKLLNNLDLIETDAPIIVGDISTRYSRFFLFHEKRIVMIRTVHGDPSKETQGLTRIINLIKILSNSLYTEHKILVSKICLFGNPELSESVKETALSQLDMMGTILETDFITHSEDKDILNYLNALGASL